MSTDFTIEQLLARAIFDLELKMKHEIRQNSALQLAKMEKYNQQMDKRLGVIEAKLEALLSRETSGTGNRDGYQQGQGSQQRFHQNRNPGYNPSFFGRPPNTANGHRHYPNTPNRMQQPASPQGHPYGAFGGDDPPASPLNAARRPQHYRYSSERRQQTRPKQTLGTGGNKAQLGEKTTVIKKSEWTTKVGIYTSGDDDSDDENAVRTGSESNGYTVAKPSPESGEVPEPKDPESDEASEQKVEEEEEADEVPEQPAEEKTEVPEKNIPESDEIPEKENQEEETTVAVIAQEPVSGGFGRGRRN